jgi:hypothetical protein
VSRVHTFTAAAGGACVSRTRACIKVVLPEPAIPIQSSTVGRAVAGAPAVPAILDNSRLIWNGGEGKRCAAPCDAGAGLGACNRRCAPYAGVPPSPHVTTQVAPLIRVRLSVGLAQELAEAAASLQPALLTGGGRGGAATARVIHALATTLAALVPGETPATVLHSVASDGLRALGTPGPCLLLLQGRRALPRVDPMRPLAGLPAPTAASPVTTDDLAGRESAVLLRILGTAGAHWLRNATWLTRSCVRGRTGGIRGLCGAAAGVPSRGCDDDDGGGPCATCRAVHAAPLPPGAPARRARGQPGRHPACVRIGIWQRAYTDHRAYISLSLSLFVRVCVCG